MRNLRLGRKAAEAVREVGAGEDRVREELQRIRGSLALQRGAGLVAETIELRAESPAVPAPADRG